ncbi:MAG: hypothetical protein ACE5E4_07020 [Candidatus Binatia bacterium]
MSPLLHGGTAMTIEYRSTGFRDRGARAVALVVLSACLCLVLAHPAAGHSRARGSGLEWAPDVAPRLRLLEEHGRAATRLPRPGLDEPPAEQPDRTPGPGGPGEAAPGNPAVGKSE